VADRLTQHGHLHIHQHEVIGSGVGTCTFQGIDSFSPIIVRLALESEALYKINGNLLVDGIILCDRYAKLITWDLAEVDNSWW
jgi:hypothetical protein